VVAQGLYTVMASTRSKSESLVAMAGIPRSVMTCKVSASFERNPYRDFICRLRSIIPALMGRISMFIDANDRRNILIES